MYGWRFGGMGDDGLMDCFFFSLGVDLFFQRIG